MTPEGRIKNLICSWLSLHRFFFWGNDSVGIFDPVKKIYRSNKSPYRIKGVSDILGCLPDGKLLAIEVKVPKKRDHAGKVIQSAGRISLDQSAFLCRVATLGGIAFVAYGVEDCENHLVRYLGKKNERI